MRSLNEKNFLREPKKEQNFFEKSPSRTLPRRIRSLDFIKIQKIFSSKLGLEPKKPYFSRKISILKIP